MEENRTMTAKERAALANAREAEAQRRKNVNAPVQRQSAPVNSQAAPAARPTAPKSAQAARPAMPKAAPNRVQGGTNSGHNTREYPKAPYIKQAAASKRPQRVVNGTAPNIQNNPDKTDTGEFPNYVRTGKGGYHPPKSKKRVVAKTHRRKLDPKFKAAIAAVISAFCIIALLMICGVRYSTYKLESGEEVRYFGLVKGGEPTSGWVFSSKGVGGKFKQGIIKYNDGSVYEGETLGALRSGEGTLTYKNGDVAKGTFSENELNGKGTVTYINGDTYDGYFKNGKKHGQGVQKYKTDDGINTYTGNFTNDKRNGKGKMEYANGDVFEGEYKDDKKDGYGVFTQTSGRKFEGTYINNLRSEGKVTFENGATFEGTFENNITNQMLEGVYTYATGTRVKGRYDKATSTFIAE